MAFVGTFLDISLGAIVIIYKYPIIIDNHCYFSFRMLALMWSPRHIWKIHTLQAGTGHPLSSLDTLPLPPVHPCGLQEPTWPLHLRVAAACSFPTQCALWPLKSQIKYAYAEWLYTSLSSNLNQNSSYTPAHSVRNYNFNARHDWVTSWEDGERLRAEERCSTATVLLSNNVWPDIPNNITSELYDIFKFMSFQTDSIVMLNGI